MNYDFKNGIRNFMNFHIKLKVMLDKFSVYNVSAEGMCFLDRRSPSSLNFLDFTLLVRSFPNSSLNQESVFVQILHNFGISQLKHKCTAKLKGSYQRESKMESTGRGALPPMWGVLLNMHLFLKFQPQLGKSEKLNNQGMRQNRAFKILYNTKNKQTTIKKNADKI